MCIINRDSLSLASRLDDSCDFMIVNICLFFHYYDEYMYVNVVFVIS